MPSQRCYTDPGAYPMRPRPATRQKDSAEKRCATIQKAIRSAKQKAIAKQNHAKFSASAKRGWVTKNEKRRNEVKKRVAEQIQLQKARKQIQTSGPSQTGNGSGAEENR
jgi:hypothetical protein